MERIEVNYGLVMRASILFVATLLVALAGCASNRAKVYVANPCDRDLYVRINYAAIIPGGDVDQLTEKVAAKSTKEFGTLGTENLEDSYIEAFSDASYTETLGTETYASPELQSVEGNDIYLMFVPAEAC